MKTRLNLLFILALSSVFYTGQAQLKVMAAPGNMKAAIKNTFPTKPAKDSTNIYEEMLNDESDDLMENHPAEDIYNNIWTSEKLNPYKVSLNERIYQYDWKAGHKNSCCLY